MVNSSIEEIKNKLDIVEVIGSYIKLKKIGANYSAVCPFHSEKKPSFFVSPVRQIWHCFGCGEGSSIFDFVMKIEGIEFGDALRILAQRAGIELKKQDPKLKTARKRLYEICELTCQFFEKQLKESSTGKEVKTYLLKRGINEESIKKWRLGYPPDIWQGLSDFLVGKGYLRKEIIGAGLAIESKKNQTPYDRFRSRIIFPVFDLNSQVIGFGGRIFEKAQSSKLKAKSEEIIAKYMNIPNTLLYDKSQVLYGLNSAKIEIRKQNQTILAEGYTDVIMSHQAGFENTVAVSGTALTPLHLNILKRYSENLLLAFDMDIAGNTATKKGIDLAQEKGFGIKIVQMPSDSDPADVISKNSKNWQKIVKEAQSILDFYFNSAFSINDKNTPEGKKEIGKRILPIIKRIPNKIEQSYWIQELAKRLEIREEDIFEEFKKTKSSTPFSENEPSPPETSTAFGPTFFSKTKGGRKQILEEKILSLIFKEPKNLNLVSQEYLPFFSKGPQQVLENFRKGKGKDFNIILADLKSEKNEEFKTFLDTFALRAEVEIEENPQEEIQLCLGELKSLEIKNKLKEISQDIKIAEEKKDEQRVSNLIKEFDELTGS